MRDLAYCGLNRVCCYNNGEPLFQSSFLKRAVIFAKEGYTWLWTLQSLTCWLEEFPLLKLSFTGETLRLQIFEIYLGFILECLSLLFAIFLFPLISLTNIAMISLQQAHAKCSEEFCSLYLGVIKTLPLICLLIIYNLWSFLKFVLELFW